MSAAAEQLLRLVHLIPLAARDEGLSVDEAAAMYGVTSEQILDDFERLADRSWYLPPGRTDDFQILMTGERIHIQVPPAFTRPPRLTLDELVACAVALRCSDRGDAGEILDEVEAALLATAEGKARSGDDAGAQAKGTPADPATHLPVQVVLKPAGADELAETVSRGVVLRRRVRFGYVKPTAPAPGLRVAEPWRVLHAQGEAYLLAHDVERGAPRLFRMDRILGVELLDAACTEPVELDAADVIEDGAVQLEAEPREPRWARVRYSPRVARWVRERWEGDESDDGSYLVRHRLFEEAWLVRHVLAHGPDAEVVEPPELRKRVVEAVGGGG